MRFLACGTSLLVVLLGSGAFAQEKELLVLNIWNAAGEARGGPGILDQAKEPTRRERPHTCFAQNEPVGRDRDGEVVRCFGFYAWRSSNDAPIQVRALLFFPAEGPTGAPPTNPSMKWRSKDFASYTMKKGQKLRMDEMKSLGLEPFVLSVDPYKPQPK